jgi:hypothetical protein
MTESRRDLALLDTLAVALEPPVAEPSASELFALRVAVASHHSPASDAATARPARIPWWRRPWAVASLATGMALAGTGAAMAAGAAPVPDPVRAVAHAIGLPIDSPAVVHVRRATDTLQRDLSKPASTSPSQAARDAQRLQQKLSGLSPSDRARVGTEPNRTLEQWRGPGASGSGSGGPGPSSTKGSPSSSGGSGQRSTGGSIDRRGASGGTSGSPQPTPTSTPPSGSGGYPSPYGDRHRSGDGTTDGSDRSGSGGTYPTSGYPSSSYPSSSYPSDGFHR